MTEDDLIKTINEVMGLSEDKTLALRPTRLLIPPRIYRLLVWRPSIAKAGSVRKRKRALYRGAPVLAWKLFRSWK